LTDNHNTSSTLGFNIGFDKYETLHYEGVEAMNKVLASWEKEIKSSGNYFLYLHYMDPHEPYHKRAPWYQEGAKNRRERMINSYDSEISYLDHHLEETFKRFNILENTILIVTSDHGEEFYEHGNRGHGHNLYTETNHVPLFIYYPGVKPQRVYERTSHVDIMPTLVSLSSLDAKPVWDGISLASVLKGRELPKRAIFSELLKLPENPRPPRRSVYVDQLHLIETMKGERSYQLFDVVRDYYEKQDLYPNQKDIAQTLKSRFSTLDDGKKDTSDQTVTVEVSDETINQLKTLGYVN
jgi:arylsulfatase A-like enzyme